MNYNTSDEFTKTNLVYLVLPKDVIITQPALTNQKLRNATNVKNLVKFEDSNKKYFATFCYKLPKKAIALEEYLDYLVINVGILAPEERFEIIMDIAIGKEKGLILKPPTVTSQLFVLDKLVQTHNKLNGFESINF